MGGGYGDMGSSGQPRYGQGDWGGGMGQGYGGQGGSRGMGQQGNWSSWGGYGGARGDWDPGQSRGSQEYGGQSHGGQGAGQGGYGGSEQGRGTTSGWYNTWSDDQDRGGASGQPGRGMHHEDHDYHHWRSQQVAKFDKDYEDWRNERRKKFSDEFDSWRGSRPQRSGSQDQDETGTSGLSGAASGTSRTDLNKK